MAAPLAQYQWYMGASGDTSSPIAGATGRTLYFRYANPTQRYVRNIYLTIPFSVSVWVRATNAEGSTDSAAVTVSF